MADKNIINKSGIINFDKLFEILVKKIGIRKKENKENLCINPPAINSSPNGPLNFLPIPTVLRPKISSP